MSSCFTAVRIVPVAVLFMLAGAPAAGAAAPVHVNCMICHESGGAPSSANLLRPLSALCIDCHADQHGDDAHQVDVVPTTPPQTVLPLQAGLLTCETCHDSHGTVRPLLRLPAEDLCKVCHAK